MRSEKSSRGWTGPCEVVNLPPARRTARAMHRCIWDFRISFMSAFEWSKIIGAVLMTALVTKVIDVVGDALVAPQELKKNVYVVGGSVVAGAAEATIPEEAAAPARKALEKIGPLLASADVETGKKVARKCAACHSFDKGGRKKVGPNLWNIVNAKRARSADFAYSESMSKAGGAWSYEELDAFLADPKRTVPGTKMAFAGLRKAQDRADVIAYLRSLSDDPAPLP